MEISLMVKLHVEQVNKYHLLKRKYPNSKD